MKKLLLLPLIAINLLATAQTTAIPDANFEQALITLGYDNVIDGGVLTANISSVDTLDIPLFSGISDLTGIEDFTALTFLDCSNNNLTSLDVSQNTALTHLNCESNLLTSLDVTQNTALEYLGCGDNQLTNLDVSQNASLTELHCDSNIWLTSLDVSQNTALTYLDCSWNQLTSLDVSQNTALTELRCQYNQLTNLDVSQNTALTWLICDHNQLTSLDVSQNTALTVLACGSNQLTNLDVTQNTALTGLYCDYNQLTSLDVTQNTALSHLICDHNQLTSLDVSQHTALEYLRCSYNNLFCLNVANGNNTNMISFNANSNPNLSCIEVDDENYSLLNWSFIDNGVTFSTDCNNSCSAICINDIINDTTTNYVSTPSFSTTSPAVYLDNTENLTNADGCDSIINHYSHFVFSATTCTDTIQIFDTTFVTINDTVTYNDTVLTSVTDTLIMDITLTGIPLPNNTNTMLVYPNPASDVVIIDNGDYLSMSGYTLKIINSLGQEVFNSTINIPVFSIPVSTLGSVGTYYIQVFDTSPNIVQTKALILQ